MTADGAEIDTAKLSTHDEATTRADRIRAGIEMYSSMLEDIVAAYLRRDWTALGYDSWDAYVTGEFERQYTLSLDRRREAVASLRGDGLSTRAIGTALGVAQDTVRRDISMLEARERDRSPDADHTSAPAPSHRDRSSTVVGIDGKTYARTSPLPQPPPHRQRRLRRRRPRSHDGDHYPIRRTARHWTCATPPREWNGSPLTTASPVTRMH
jgi:DNA-binding CsgD family transcriptional regulator